MTTSWQPKHLLPAVPLVLPRGQSLRSESLRGFPLGRRRRPSRWGRSGTWSSHRQPSTWKKIWGTDGFHKLVMKSIPVLTSLFCPIVWSGWFQRENIWRNYIWNDDLRIGETATRSSISDVCLQTGTLTCWVKHEILIMLGTEHLNPQDVTFICAKWQDVGLWLSSIFPENGVNNILFNIFNQSKSW